MDVPLDPPPEGNKTGRLLAVSKSKIGKGTKKQAKKSPRPATIVYCAKVSDFRDLVQKLTGITSPASRPALGIPTPIASKPSIARLHELASGSLEFLPIDLRSSVASASLNSIQGLLQNLSRNNHSTNANVPIQELFPDTSLASPDFSSRLINDIRATSNLYRPAGNISYRSEVACPASASQASASLPNPLQFRSDRASLQLPAHRTLDNSTNIKVDLAAPPQSLLIPNSISFSAVDPPKPWMSNTLAAGRSRSFNGF